MIAKSLLPLLTDRPDRQSRDRLEIVTALLGGPSVDPIFRCLVVRVPPNHTNYGWACAVDRCQRPRVQRFADGLCSDHLRQWNRGRESGIDRAQFLVSAVPLEPLAQPGRRPNCRVCQERPSTGSDSQLCRRHQRRWAHARVCADDELLLEEWVQHETAFAGFGDCSVHACAELADSPLQLCRWHETAYRQAGRPGGVRLPARWIRDYDSNNRVVPVTALDRQAFQCWCATAPGQYCPGQLNLRGLRPLLRAELQWGLFKHAEGARANWRLPWVQRLVNRCREQEANSLADLHLDRCDHHSSMIAKEMLGELRLVYFTPADTREAGYIDTDHFGVRFPQRASYFGLAEVSQRWLRNMLWDFLTDRLRSPDCPRSAQPFDTMRRGCTELSAFLKVEAPQDGHDPALLREEHMHRFVADLQHRERNQLPSLGIHRGDGKPSTMTPLTRKHVLETIRKLLRNAMETGAAEQLGLDRTFIIAVPLSGYRPQKPRRPFPDDVARALADDANLRHLAAVYDPQDHGLRDIWEVLVVTGRRASEARQLRLDCAQRHLGLALLWHDQTKVGNYDAAIRIPEALYEQLLGRRHKTIKLFTERHGRHPAAEERAAMALFPTSSRNPLLTASMSYAWFNQQFRKWVDQLDLGHYVSHQARHTLATSLLRHGATLTHIRKYLGQVSDRMAEHYVSLSHSDLEDVLHRVWVAGPGAANPGDLLTNADTPLTGEQAQALAIDLSRRSTPAEGGFCTFQPVVDGGACPWNMDCHNCDKFVLSGADLLYWRRKREQWRQLAEGAPDDATATYLHQYFEPTARAIDGLEKALAGLGLLGDALALDLRKPQDYFHRVWATAFRAADLADAGRDQDDELAAECGEDPGDTCA